MKAAFLSILFIALFSQLIGQEISIHLEELTTPDYIKAVEKSEKTCLLPIGVFEKHGAHLPLGTDLYIAREYASRAAKQEYTVIFPWYYFSQINEARHQPGTIAYSPELIWKMLQETLDELSRNGFEKIIIVNGHGGNNAFLNYFGMAQLSENRNYSLYLFQPDYSSEKIVNAAALTPPDKYDSHAGKSESSMMSAIVPEAVHLNRAHKQSGADLDRIKHMENIYTGIWWYASYPNHYGGDGALASAEAGKLILEGIADQLVEVIKTVKTDSLVPALENQFYKDSAEPIKTKQ
ncbi:MAG: creatininase family protein [Prolixibacteraceae bacterium]|jgi:creatinine amidohydrolase|nr:creatininase family protein [Prolixibacteraceae bacterium]